MTWLDKEPTNEILSEGIVLIRQALRELRFGVSP